MTQPKRRRIPTSAALVRRLDSHGRAISALKRQVRELKEKLDIKPVDAIGFFMDRHPDADEEDD